MTRSEIITKNAAKDSTPDVESINARDAASLKAIVAKTESEYLDAEDHVKNYLKNPEARLNGDFILLVEKRDALKARLALIASIKEEYIA